MAANSPSRLQPAVDLDWSAWGLASSDPKFLLELTEAYYIDTRDRDDWGYWNGIRHHISRGFQGLSNHTYGPFRVLARMCPHEDWIPVVNRMLNHAASIRCRSADGSGSVDPDSKFTLAIDGAERTYVGDSSVWGWYRGNTNGPYPCMSALQAVERWVDRMVADGAAIEDVATALLDGCENLAMPALIVGATIRHLGEDSTVLDRYLVEPLIWQFDSIRVTQEAVGLLRAADDGIINPERRKLHLRDIVLTLVLSANPERRRRLNDLGAQLVSNVARFDVGESTVRRWAAAFDANNIANEPIDGGVLVWVQEPPDIEDELAPTRADLARGSLLLGLQNKYWIPPRQQKEGWTPPTPGEVAEDLELVKDLHEKPPAFASSDLDLVLAHVAAAAVHNAAAGHPEAFGSNATFAITSILDILRNAADRAAHDIDALRSENDLGTRGAAATALPHLLLPELAGALATAGATPEDVAAAATILGTLAATNTCLEFARACDTVWTHSCSGDPCIHLTHYQLALDLARRCEIGEFDEELQHRPALTITGDVMAHIPAVLPGRLATPRLSATIRALGRAASSSACVAETSQRDLTTLLLAQSKAMVNQESSERIYFVDDHGAETMTAARALLHNRSGSDASDSLLLEYVKILAPASHVFGAFLRDLATVGSETQELADAARGIWPILFSHVMDQVKLNKAIYERADSFNDYALSHLLPNHPGTDLQLHSELGRHTFRWVNADAIAGLIPRWLPHAAGRSACLLALIRLLRELPIGTQLTDGLAWVESLCLSRSDRQIASYPPMDEWLVEMKTEADARGAGGDWLGLVDRLVYAGNKTLAGYSR